MTGFASEFKSTEKYDIAMEIKSVNSRYFEFKLKSPSAVDEWENEIKNTVFEKLKRGKIDFFIKIIEKDAENYNIVLNQELGKKYHEALLNFSRELNIPQEISLKEFISLPNMLQLERIGNTEELLQIVIGMLGSLLRKILEMMHAEGSKTKEDILNSLAIITESVIQIEKLSPENLEKYKNNLKERIDELIAQDGSNPLASNRVLMEIELVASRTAINEEIVRLKSHISQFNNILSDKVKGDSKKMDFIGQEMNRETNTIASKSSDYTIIENTIAIKGEIEKIREQLRNLE